MKEYSHFLDTNIFLRVIAKDNLARAHECESVFKQMQAGGLRAVTNTLVLAEIVWTGMRVYKISKKDILSVVKSLTKTRGLKIVDRYDISTALALYEQHAIKFIDALIASFLKRSATRLTLISYDRDFDKLGIKRVEPAELLKEL